jgi:hypothetical protein
VSDKKWETVGFGCPKTVDPHHFVVEIPAGRTAPVLIYEVYGIKAGINGQPDIAERCVLSRSIWSQIAEDLKQEFNDRLRAKKMNPSRWTTGRNLVERLLGKELLVLAWAVERAKPEAIPNAIRNWRGLRPEERWWLYTMTAAATGGVDHGNIGWRKALRYALTENPLTELSVPTPVKRPYQPACSDSLRSEAVEADQLSLLSCLQEDPSPFWDSEATIGTTKLRD